MFQILDLLFKFLFKVQSKPIDKNDPQIIL